MYYRNVKAKIKLPNGTVVELEGEPDVIAKTAVEMDRKAHKVMIGSIQKRTIPPGESKSQEDWSNLKPTEALQKIIEEGFFEKGHTIDEVANELSQKGLVLTGKKRSGIALVLSLWARDGRYQLRKESLTEKEKAEGRAKGTYRYFTSA